MATPQNTSQGSLDIRRLLHGARSTGVVVVVLMFGLLLLGWYMMRTGKTMVWVPMPKIIRDLQHPAVLQNNEGTDVLSQQLQAVVQPETDSPPTGPQVIYTSQGQRDPFVGPLHLQLWAEARRNASASKVKTVPVMPPPPLHIQGVILGGATPYAIVNNEAVSPGDTIAGVEVVRIEPNGIVGQFQGREVRYSMEGAEAGPGDAPRPPAAPASIPPMGRPYF